MTAFRFVSGTFALLIGLGVARLLTSLVTVFLAREAVKLRWVPLSWAFAVFVLQVQFAWAIIELDARIAVWTRETFVSVLLVPLALFVAAALLLPADRTIDEKDLDGWFQRNGRWGLLALSGYAVLALHANARCFGMPLLSMPCLALVLEASLPAVYFWAPGARSKVLLSVLYLGLVLLTAWKFSPAAY